MVTSRLCGTFLSTGYRDRDTNSVPLNHATEQSLQTQLDQIYSMMWPGDETETNIQNMPWTTPLGLTPREND